MPRSLLRKGQRPWPSCMPRVLCPFDRRGLPHLCRQTFLMAVVGPGEDALLKAAELANKFEHHVFASTTSKVPPVGWDELAAHPRLGGVLASDCHENAAGPTAKKVTVLVLLLLLSPRCGPFPIRPYAQAVAPLRWQQCRCRRERHWTVGYGQGLG